MRATFSFRDEEWEVSISPAELCGTKGYGFEKVATLVTNDVTRCYCPFNHLPWDDDRTVLAVGVRKALGDLGFFGGDVSDAVVDAMSHFKAEGSA